MSTVRLRFINKIPTAGNSLFLVSHINQLKETEFKKEEIRQVQHALERRHPITWFKDGPHVRIVAFEEGKPESWQTDEAWRKHAAKASSSCEEQGVASLTVRNLTGDPHVVTLVAEGLLLSCYRFLKYRTGSAYRPNTLKEIRLLKDEADEKAIHETELIATATLKARDLVNEPLSYLTAEQLSREIRAMGKEAGFKVQVFNKAQIKKLKMGGLLAVNQGSPNPPTFNILEWKPPRPRNKQPYVLVGKGVVFDTGGLSLKPTPGSMDMMKCDMAGAAAVACAIYAVARARLPVHVVGLIPATENRPGGNAYAPGDVLTMHNGTTVEVLNTDAEGRLILADALSYARRYRPQLVIDLATLTGAAARAIGPEGIVFMGTASEAVKKALSESGYRVYERLVEFPLWDEYENYLKSDIADIKNIGGPNAGAITAGMFLKKFTDYPWLHLDIAGPAFLDKPDGYRPKNGSGVGVRLLFDFLKNHVTR
ncbi:MAG: putative cytosol aminopeptidase [Chitinophagales bacterium]|nr:MAG: putative cytosol aminopeptidase [Chitinophagales bacterium]